MGLLIRDGPAIGLPFRECRVDYGGTSRDLRIKDAAFRRDIGRGHFKGICNGFSQ